MFIAKMNQDRILRLPLRMNEKKELTMNKE